MFEWAERDDTPEFEYYGISAGMALEERDFFAPLTKDKTAVGATRVEKTESGITVSGGTLNATAAVPKRLAPGHGACPGCGIPVNLNLLLRAIEDPVVLLFQTGSGKNVRTPIAKTSNKVP